ncbi:2-C-methyl-D-erythritol 2,4-cyclodiphosphate synthase [bacterium]|nr:MAG: 2-C-methyl-D-erythritol 2,4-cyclodiphosphate synthase [bacterium]
MRVGIGYDIHRTVKNRKLILGGVEIPFEFGLEGHSDADVLIHAIIDALLGAAALGDIGTHFPDTDPKYENISSIELLKNTHKILVDNMFQIVDIDSTIIAERPKLLPYIQNMRENIASALDINIEQISVKAKTNEGLDSIGRGEAIAAIAVATVCE